jgi:ribonuclease HI
VEATAASAPPHTHDYGIGETLSGAATASRLLSECVRATLYTDGAARHKTGEPTGPAGIGAVLRSESGEVIGEIAEGIGLATNNVAEYTALIAGLQMALDASVTDIDVHFDSPVLAGHLLKGHTVKADHLRPLVERVRQLLDLFSTSSLARVPRALNAHADKLANQGIDHAIGTTSAQLPN